MLLHFTKMHGLGNDFMMIDRVTQSVRLTPDKIRHLADRHVGIGFDQLLMVDPPTDPDMDFCYRIFNADGSEVEQCGNGARCFARFVYDKKLIGHRVIRVQTMNGHLELRIQNDGDVTVNMGLPELKPRHVPFKASKTFKTYDLNVDGERLSIGVVSMGNPHAVLQVDDINRAPVVRLGAKIEAHHRFPKHCNAGFMQVLDARDINLRVYERGAGETRACGSGACAAVVAGRIQGLLDEKVRVNLPGGTLYIEWLGEGHPVMMTGGATWVYEGQVRI